MIHAHTMIGNPYYSTPISESMRLKSLSLFGSTELYKVKLGGLRYLR